MVENQLRQGKLAGLLIFASSRYCPWCGLVANDQLLPRLRAVELPQVAIVEFDINDAKPLQLDPTHQAARLVIAPKTSPSAWAKTHNVRVVPTVVAVNRQLYPLRPGLVGYNSVDFYSAYLEEQIVASVNYWARPH